MSNNIIKVYPQRGHLLNIDGKYYKLKGEHKSDGRTVDMQEYIEVDESDYREIIRDLSHNIAVHSNLSIETVIYDAVKDLPLDRVMELRSELDKAKQIRKKERDATKPTPVAIERSGCVELQIGDQYLVIRE